MRDFVSANRMGEWIDEACDCGEWMGGGGGYIVVRIWTILMGFRRIVPCTNLNIDDILNLERSRDPPDKLQISFQGATERQRSRNPGAKTMINTNLRLAEALASTSNTGSLNVGTRPLFCYKHLPTIRLSDERINLKYCQLEHPRPSAEGS